MRIHWHYICVILSCILYCSCSSPSMRQLQELETRVNDVPDSVLAVLTAADMPRWGEARALYALLTVEAQDKSYIDVADDSLIRVATRYYDRRGPALHRLQAFYYHGRVYANAGLRHEAMTAYTRAMDYRETALCPRCGVDTVLGDAAGIPFYKELIEKMHRHYFG